MKNIYIINICKNLCILILLIIIYYILWLNKVYCENEIENVFKNAFLSSSCTDQEMHTIISTLKKIDKNFLTKIGIGKQNFKIYNGDLFYIDINADILKLQPKTKEIKLLQEILRLKKNPFSLILFADPAFYRSFDSINMNNIRVTSDEVEKFLFYHDGGIDFAEYGECEIITDNNIVIPADFLLIKYPGDSEKLYNLYKENLLFTSDLFIENILRIGKSKQLKLCVYPDQPLEKARGLYEILKLPIRENQGLLFCCLDRYHNLGTLIEAYETTPLINWFLECTDIKYIKSIKFIRQDINNYLKNSLVKEQYNISLKELLSMWKNKKISDIQFKNYIHKQGPMWANWNKFWVRFLIDFANEGVMEREVAKQKQVMKDTQELLKNIKKIQTNKKFKKI